MKEVNVEVTTGVSSPGRFSPDDAERFNTVLESLVKGLPAK